MTPARIEEYRERLRTEVLHCATCRPQIGDPARAADRVMEDLLENLEVPPEAWKDVVSGLRCPHCGSSVELGANVSAKTTQERLREELWARWMRRLRPEFDDFQEHLERCPYLGLDHPIGQRTARLIELLPRQDIRGEAWFRARTPDGSRSLTLADLLPPDPAKVPIPEGRYNHFGQAVFYLARTDEGAAREKVGDAGGVVWIQEYRLTQQRNVLVVETDPCEHPPPDIDLLAFGILYDRHLRREVPRSPGWTPEYLVPRFIADCARHGGVSGIRFTGARSSESNLVLFSWNLDEIVPVGEPRILQVHERRASL